MEIYYRMADRLMYEGGEIKIELEKFQVVKRTPKGAWIIPHAEPGWWQSPNPKKRFVLDGDGRRYAYPTVDAAHKSYLRRKVVQISRLEDQMLVANVALKVASAPDFEPNKTYVDDSLRKFTSY
jgi:hypothetical protein